MQSYGNKIGSLGKCNADTWARITPVAGMENRGEIEKSAVKARSLGVLGLVLLFLGWSVQNRFDWVIGIVITSLGVAFIAISIVYFQRIKCEKCSKPLGKQVIRGGLTLRGKLRLNYCPFCGERL